MSTDLLNLFTEPAVALLYFLSVILLSQGAMFMALGQRFRSSRDRGATRYTLASLGVMLAWMVLMGGAMFVLITRRPYGLILPPLDRAVNAIVVLMVGWAFLTIGQVIRTPQAGQRDGITYQMLAGGLTPLVALALSGVIVGYVYTATQWYSTGQGGFNLSIYNTAWIVGTTAVTLLFLIVTVVRFRKTVDAPLKILFFAFVLAGYGFTLFSIFKGTLTGDDIGAVRLAFLAAMPFLPVVVYRMVIERLTAQIDSKSAQVLQSALTNSRSDISTPETEREAPALLKALGMMLERDEPETLPIQVAQTIATMLKADVAAVLVLDDAEYADVVACYDNIKQAPIAAMALKMDEQPTLREAILQKVQERLFTDQHLNELVDLYTRLDIQKIGPAYFQPLSREGGIVGALVVALPYTQRDLRPNEMKLLEAMAPIATRLIGISRAAQTALLHRDEKAVQDVVEGGAQLELPPSAARAEMQATLEVARSQINDLSGRVRDLQIELDFERGRLADLVANESDGLSITQRINRMSEERRQLEAERERLMQALQEAQTRLASASGNEDEVYSTVVRTLQTERDELQIQKDKLESQLTEIRQHGNSAPPAAIREMMTRLSEERASLAVERDQIKDQLGEVESQLQALGIEGGATGLAAVIFQLTDERSRYKAVAEKALQQRDVLIAERHRIKDLIAQQATREGKIAALEVDLRRLAEDREALQRQRDALRHDRESMNNERERWETQRARMVAEMAALQSDLEEALFDRNRLNSEIQNLAEERASLVLEHDKLYAERVALQTERDQFAASTQGNREMMQRFGADGLDQMRQMIDSLTEERGDVERQLRQMQEHARILESQLEQAETKLAKSVQLPLSVTVDASDAEVMLSIAQELRTPMSSIAGYVDLLLGESVGILGALQRQFLQRVKANADRLSTLLEDFIRVTALDTGQVALDPQNVDVIEVIDDAITSTRTQFKEKGITLKMDIPDHLPAVHGDRDALQQIIVQLLSNAYLASPTDGEVAIQAKLDRSYTLPGRNGASERKADVIYFAVRDYGAGIPPEEQKRVFSRLYRADTQLIQGIGDTGVGLSIARALTEMHGGQIWVESTQGKGSIFKLVVPLSGIQTGEKVVS